MLTKLKRAWRQIMGDDKITQARACDGAFRLMLGSLHMGTLKHERGKWQFKYTDAFCRRADLRTIVQFPDRSKAYQSEELWPFFGIRIPSLKQPSVQATIEREHIDQSDRVQLLRRFGRRTVANPYELVDAAPE